MNVRDFLDVRVICETGSLRKAAATLGVTQPTLSVRIAHLEDQLGAKLFDRSRGRSKPTELALFIARRAHVMAEEAARLMEDARRLSAGRGGLVRIGLSSGLRRMFCDVAADLAQRHPGMSLDLVSAPTTWVVDQLLQRRFDLIVCPALDAPNPDVVSEPLFTAQIVAFANPAHPLCRNPPDTVAGLFRYPIALPVTEQRYVEVLRRDFGIDIDNLPGRILCSDPSMLALIVSGSRRLFTAAPDHYFETEVGAGQLQAIRTPVPLRHPLFLHWNRDAYPLPAVERVKRAVRKAAVAMQSKSTAAASPAGIRGK